jgi:hypothetical protein
MPMDAARMAKTPITLVLDEQEYKLAPIEPADLGDIEVWLREQPFKKVRRRLELLGSQVSAEQRAEMIRAAEEEAELTDITTAETIAKLSTLEAVGFILYLGLRKHQPEITQVEAACMVTLENMGEIQEAIDKVSSLGKVLSPASKRKKKPRPVRRVSPGLKSTG